MPVQADPAVDARRLLPTDHAYYHYEGSLRRRRAVRQWTALSLIIPSRWGTEKRDIADFAKLYPMNARSVTVTGASFSVLPDVKCVGTRRRVIKPLFRIAAPPRKYIHWPRNVAADPAAANAANWQDVALESGANAASPTSRLECKRRAAMTLQRPGDRVRLTPEHAALRSASARRKDWPIRMGCWTKFGVAIRPSIRARTGHADEEQICALETIESPWPPRDGGITIGRGQAAARGAEPNSELRCQACSAFPCLAHRILDHKNREDVSLVSVRNAARAFGKSRPTARLTRYDRNPWRR